MKERCVKQVITDIDMKIRNKINQMITETREHPFVFKIDGAPVFVSFPPEAFEYFTPPELKMAEQIILRAETPELESYSVPQNEKASGLRDKLSFAKSVADNMSRIKERHDTDKSRLI